MPAGSHLAVETGEARLGRLQRLAVPTPCFSDAGIDKARSAPLNGPQHSPKAVVQ